MERNIISLYIYISMHTLLLKHKHNNGEKIRFINRVVHFNHLAFSETNIILSFTLPTENTQIAFQVGKIYSAV